MAKEVITGAEALMRSLKNEDVKTIFGYPGGAVLPIYDALLPKGWFRVDRPALADGARPRVESLWISPNAVTQPSLLEAA